MLIVGSKVCQATYLVEEVECCPQSEDEVSGLEVTVCKVGCHLSGGRREGGGREEGRNGRKGGKTS